MKRVGIVGCGTIGSFFAKRIHTEFKGSAQISGLFDIDKSKANELLSELAASANILELEELIERSDVIIEASSKGACASICKQALSRGRDVIVMSIGGILGNEYLFDLAKENNAKMILPSGAICGLDGLKSASSGKIDSVTITTRKPPKGLMGAPYIEKMGINLETIKDEQIVFEGNALQAIEGFPKNVNVSAVLSLAGIGPEKTKVKIITSPNFTSNTHEIEVVGEFGKLTARTENLPFPENPKTSCLAAYAALASFKQYLNDSVRIGT
ncbi:MAG: aspartate dehydrogenase [Candidatus Omnitrophota bacterium]